MPVKIYWCVAIVALWTSLCSFACSKSSDDAARQNEENKVIVDFRNFPAHTTWVLFPDNGGPSIRFDSDSLKYYEVNIPTTTTYRIHWKLVNVVPEPMYKAKWLNTSQGTSVGWESGLYTYNGRHIHGTYTFTKERK